MISERLLLVLGVIKFVQLLSALSVLVLAFVAPDYIFVSVIVFGITAAVMAAVMLVEGLTKGRLITRKTPVSRAEQPIKFWGLIGLNVLVLLIGLALTQFWRLTQ